MRKTEAHGSSTTCLVPHSQRCSCLTPQSTRSEGWRSRLLSAFRTWRHLSPCHGVRICLRFILFLRPLSKQTHHDFPIHHDCSPASLPGSLHKSLCLLLLCFWYHPATGWGNCIWVFVFTTVLGCLWFGLWFIFRAAILAICLSCTSLSFCIQWVSSVNLFYF